jgi:catechol 2,3-dioxygenase
MIDMNTTFDQQLALGSGLHPATRLGSVHLTVSDLDRSVGFYRRSLGLELHRSAGQTAYLGAGGEDLLALVEQPGATYAPRRSGLYHFALLVPSRLALAHSLKRLFDTDTQIQGFADHLVSEAIYLPDPDGIGIEIYCDRPRSDWKYVNGRLQMGTLPFDARGVMAELEHGAGSWEGIPADTVLGHIHLHVSEIAAAEAFYVDVLGFDKVLGIGSATFVSAGGYHHHIAFNIWNGAGAPPAPPDSVGLRYFSVHLSDEPELERLMGRLRIAGIACRLDAQGLWVRDPSGNALVFRV